MELFDLVELHIEKNALSQASTKKYHSVIEQFVKNTKIRCVKDIDYQTVISWREAILARSTPGNWNNYHRHMRAVLQTAVEFGYIEDNLFKTVKSIVHYPEKQHTLSKMQIKHLLNLCEDIDVGWFWQSVIQTLRYTGIRRRQLVGLNWSDFYLENKSLRMRASSSKTKRAYTIPINQEVIDSILLIKQQSKTTCSADEQIFNITKIKPRYKANRMNEEHLARFFVKVSKIANFAVSAHRFRHTFATTLANNGTTNIKTVQNLLGHSSVHTTLGYVHPSMNNMRDAVNLL